MAEIENQSAIQQLAASQQDYVASLTELRQQMGIPEYAGSLEPAGPLRVPEPIAPGDEEHLLHTALSSRPEIQAAAAQVASSRRRSAWPAPIASRSRPSARSTSATKRERASMA